MDGGPLPTDALEALTKLIWAGHAEFVPELNLLRPTNQQEARPLGGPPPIRETMTLPTFKGGAPGPGPQPVLAVLDESIDRLKPANQEARPLGPAFLRQPPTETQASQSANVTSNFETANGLAIVTPCCGPSSSERPFSFAGEPIMNSPAGTTTISDSPWRTPNASPRL